jgi:serine/threonine protein kinase
MRSVEEQTGDRFGPYRLEQLLGEGSMGRVWRARHVWLGRPAAIKVLRPEHTGHSAVVDRFFDEARAINRIRNEHIVEVWDFVEERDPHRVYCVMEHLDGRCLSDAAPLPVQACIAVMRQLCEALGAAHREGVVHRDVKPDNIFLVHRPGAPLFVKVLDFGVARLSDELRRGSVSRTAQGSLLGTPKFMAPEQISGGEVDGRCDVYAVGCLLYWLLSGRLPFESEHFGQLSMQIVQQEPPPLPATTPGGERVPRVLAELTRQCLAKDPRERPATMEAVALGLERPIKLRAVHRPGRKAAALVMAVGAALAAAAAWSFSAEPATEVVPNAKVERKAVVVDVDGTLNPFAR